MPGTDVDDYNDKRVDETHHTFNNAADGLTSAASCNISFSVMAHKFNFFLKLSDVHDQLSIPYLQPCPKFEWFLY